MTQSADTALALLPKRFRYTEARLHISERQLRSLIKDGRIAAISRGLYRKSDWHGDEDLAEISARSERATLCLRSALVRHNLLDDIPLSIDVAVPRGSWTPATIAPVDWHHFDPETFDVGRELYELDGVTIGLYNVERSIIDAFRLRHIAGYETAHDALKSWLRHGGHPADLLRVAKSFPRVVAPLRRTIEILL